MKIELDGASGERQAELFSSVDVGNAAHPSRRIGSTRRSRQASTDHGYGLSLSAMAEILDGSDDYRVMRRLRPRSLVPVIRPAPVGTSIGVIVDTETTGLDHSKDEVIELGMIAFTYADGVIGDVVGVFSALREPTVEISPEITRITGITAEMVAGQSIDIDAVAAFVENADLVIAHNAKFDRPFCEKLAPGFDYKPWACSVSEVDWTGLGFEGTKLGYLVGQCGWFHNGHRAVDDCHALLEVLASTSRTEAPHPFAQLATSAERTRLRLWAEGSPFHMKDILKERGYRWNDGSDGRPKSWWVEVEEEAHAAEIAFLHEEIYHLEVDVWVERLSACERFKV